MELAFRPLVRDDFPLLGTWIGRPHVAPWWREDPSPAAVEAAYGPAVDGSDPTEMFVVELEGRPVGFVQRYLVADDPSWQRALDVAGPADAADAAGIDYLIGEPDLIGAGVGPAVIDRFTEETLGRFPDVTCVVVAVQQSNRRSWRALEKAGYERVFIGTVTSGDPSDGGPSYVYRRSR